MSLVDFLLARIAEDEAAIRAFPYPPDDVEKYLAQSMEGPLQDDEYLTLHIGAGRMMAECDAKRQIVELHRPFDQSGVIARRTLELLAMPYANHRDFDPAWT